MGNHEWRKRDAQQVPGVNYVLPNGRRIWTATSRSDNETILFLDERERDIADLYWWQPFSSGSSIENPDCWMFSRDDILDPDTPAVESRLQANVPFREMDALLKRTEGEFWASRQYLGYKGKAKIYLNAAALGLLMIVLGVGSIIGAGIIDPTASASEGVDIHRIERQLPIFFGINLCLLLVGVACDSFPFIATFVDRCIARVEHKMNEQLWPDHSTGSLQTMKGAW